MISASDFRNGKTFVYEGKPCVVLEFQHVKPGKGAAFVRTKFKNIITGAITETSFNPTAKFDEAFIERKTMAYSYRDGNLFYFMDNETFEMVPVDETVVGDSLKFVKENVECKISIYDGSVFLVEGPDFVELQITECEPGVKGNTATGATKPCTVETGATLQVPLFIENGEVIKIDTRSGEYLSRA